MACSSDSSQRLACVEGMSEEEQIMHAIAISQNDVGGRASWQQWATAEPETFMPYKPDKPVKIAPPMPAVRRAAPLPPPRPVAEAAPAAAVPAVSLDPAVTVQDAELLHSPAWTRLAAIFDGLSIKHEYLRVLVHEEMDEAALKVSTDADLKDLNLPKGIRMKLLKWIEAHAAAQGRGGSSRSGSSGAFAGGFACGGRQLEEDEPLEEALPPVPAPPTAATSAIAAAASAATAARSSSACVRQQQVEAALPLSVAGATRGASVAVGNPDDVSMSSSIAAFFAPTPPLSQQSAEIASTAPPRQPIPLTRGAAAVEVSMVDDEVYIQAAQSCVIAAHHAMDDVLENGHLLDGCADLNELCKALEKKLNSAARSRNYLLAAAFEKQLLLFRSVIYTKAQAVVASVPESTTGQCASILGAAKVGPQGGAEDKKQHQRSLDQKISQDNKREAQTRKRETKARAVQDSRLQAQEEATRKIAYHEELSQRQDADKAKRKVALAADHEAQERAGVNAEEKAKKARAEERKLERKERQDKLEADEELKWRKRKEEREAKLNQEQRELQQRQQREDADRRKLAEERVLAEQTGKEALSKFLRQAEETKQKMIKKKHTEPPADHKASEVVQRSSAPAVVANRFSQAYERQAASTPEEEEEEKEKKEKEEEAREAPAPVQHVEHFVVVDSDAPVEVLTRDVRIPSNAAMGKVRSRLALFNSNPNAHPLHGGMSWSMCSEDVKLMFGVAEDTGLSEESDTTSSCHKRESSGFAAEDFDGGCNTTLNKDPLFTLEDMKRAKKALNLQPRSLLSFGTVEFSRSALHWIQSADVYNRQCFIRTLEEIAEDPELSLYLLKSIQGQESTPDAFPLRSAPCCETCSIVWQQRPKNEARPSAIIVHNIVPHDKTSSAGSLVDSSYKRMREQNPDISGVPEVLLNPGGSSPVPYYELPLADVHELGKSSVPMRLTNEELDVVTNSTMVLGRSGTGKTNCVVERMRRNILASLNKTGLPPRQAFLARSRSICNQAQRMLRKTLLPVGVELNAKFWTMDETLGFLQAQAIESLNGELPRTWPEYARMQFNDFELLWNQGEILPNVSPAEKKLMKSLEPLDVWREIRGNIKGGAMVAFGCEENGRPLASPLSLSEYLELSQGVCPIEREIRAIIFKCHLSWTSFLHCKSLWDDCDRVLYVLRLALPPGSYAFGGNPPFDKMCVDEVQDATMTELALCLLAVNSDPRNLLLAGDTAQAVEAGSSFRFEEVRSLFYQVARRIKGESVFPQAQKVDHLSRNYRSHAAILKIASLPLDALQICFSATNTTLPEDKGLGQGPTPGIVITKNDLEQALLLARDRKMVVITRDEDVESLKTILEKKVSERIKTLLQLKAEALNQDLNKELEKELSELRQASLTIIGINASKGLEFEDCALVNVFGTASLSKALQDAWLQLFDLMASEETLAALVSKKKLQEQAAMLRLPRIFERELKQLYVALTRARSKLFVVEVLPDEYAKRSHLVMGVVRALERMRLANVSAILPRAMSPEEWLMRGLMFANAGNTDNPTDAKANLTRAVRAFEKGGFICQQFEARARAALQYWEDRRAVLGAPTPEIAVSIAAQSATELVDMGLLHEASSILKLLPATTLLESIQDDVAALLERCSTNASYRTPEKRMETLVARAEDLDSEAMLDLAELFEQGTPYAEQNDQKCIQLIERAARAGSLEALLRRNELLIQHRCSLSLSDPVAMTKLLKRALRLSSWKHARYDALYQGKPLSAARKGDAERYLNTLFGVQLDRVLNNLASVLKIVRSKRVFDRWKDQSIRQILKRVLRNLNRPRMHRAFVQFKNTAANHRKNIKNLKSDQSLDLHLDQIESGVSPKTFVPVPETCSTVFWNGKVLQRESRHPTTGLPNRGPVRVVIVPLKRRPKDLEVLKEASAKRLDQLLSKSKMRIEAQEKDSRRKKDEAKARKQTKIGKDTRDSNAQRSSELEAESRLMDATFKKISKEEDRIRGEEFERLKTDIDEFRAKAALLGTFGVTDCCRTQVGLRGSIMYTVSLESGSSIVVPGSWLVLEWELTNRCRVDNAIDCELVKEQLRSIARERSRHGN